MERLLKYKFSTATLGEKKANVKREVHFALLSLGSFYISRSIPESTANCCSHLPAKQICGLRNPVEMITGTPAGNPMVYSYFSRRRRIDIS
jgi:hypothetical protein